MSDEALEQPLTEAHYAAIGRVAVVSATLENVLELGIWKILSKASADGEQITGKWMLERKRDAFFEHVEAKFSSVEDAKVLADLKTRSGDAVADRRRLIHGSWAFGVAADAPVLVNYREHKKQAGNLRSWTPAEIEAVATSITSITDEIINFLERHRLYAPSLK